MFFVVTLIGFFFVGRMGVYPTLVAVTFFLWMGVFNLMVIAQFWSFANDLYSAGARQAPVRHRRIRRFGRRDRRRAHYVDVHRPAGHPADDAARQRASC